MELIDRMREVERELRAKAEKFDKKLPTIWKEFESGKAVAYEVAADKIAEALKEESKNVDKD